MQQAMGNPGKRARRDDEPIAPKDDLAPPAWLTAGGRTMWDLLLPTLCAFTPRLVSRADELTLARYCNMHARLVELYEQRERIELKTQSRGLTYSIKTSKGATTGYGELPLAKEIDRLEERLLKYESVLGMTPSARSSLHVRFVQAIPAPPSGPAQSQSAPEDIWTRRQVVGKIGG
jgi:P27 family predicted phage terminase small subunit